MSLSTLVTRLFQGTLRFLNCANLKIRSSIKSPTAYTTGHKPPARRLADSRLPIGWRTSLATPCRVVGDPALLPFSPLNRSFGLRQYSTPCMVKFSLLYYRSGTALVLASVAILLSPLSNTFSAVIRKRYNPARNFTEIARNNPQLTGIEIAPNHESGCQRGELGTRLTARTNTQ